MTHAAHVLDEFQILDTPPEPEFEALVEMVVALFGTSHAELSLVTPDRVWLKAAIPRSGISHDNSETLCDKVASGGQALVISDAEADPSLAGHPRVGVPGGVRFYAGVPLITSRGEALGALCAWDEQPREPTAEQMDRLGQLGMMAVSLLELRRSRLALLDRDAVLNASTAVLDLIVRGVDLLTILDTLAKAVEAAFPATLCSIQILDGDQLRFGAGPRLPAAYNQAIDGIHVGPEVGSCGTAVHRRDTVIVTDIATDPLWSKWKVVALEHGLGACWSIPIISSAGIVLGTFAQYYRDTRAPTAEDLVQMRRWVNLAEVAMTRAADLAALRDAATYDNLTGLMNRAAVLNLLQQSIDQRDPGMALLFVDLDQFKFINDTFGHAVGDQFLEAVAARLVAIADPAETVARFGGDEFLVVCPGVVDRAEADRRGQRIVTALRQPITHAGRTISLSVSVGVAMHAPGSDGRAADLVGDADLAMYAAKRSGRNSVAAFSDDLREQAAGRLSMEGELDKALENGDLTCDYQPIVEIRTGRVIALEALMRWRTPGRPEVPPGRFIPTAEESGQIFALGELALRRACTQMMLWRSAASHWRDVTLWINVSPRQLRDPSFPDLVDSVLVDTGFPAKSLGLEVSETSFVYDSPVAKQSLKYLRGKGIKVAIDDFGTGYSSLAQLRELPVDVLKIDRQFVTDLGSQDSGPGIIEAIVALGRVLKLEVVAEGVETEAERERLLATGCTVGQGFLWSRPVRPEKARIETEFLRPREFAQFAQV
ncbi:EAL domain-containing protein [Nakamurella sp. YIM 132087]|uniref:EAL domain-containing protein n=1 Tax=Nakamurella alba TaxID=2665158 RepID=A0A7K1FIK8_9ACTN|nr:EAL domain-containing protein [Nakamurella alba]MTD13910.1 EAL domain-containing protein [Nakamurella alba]